MDKRYSLMNLKYRDVHLPHAYMAFWHFKLKGRKTNVLIGTDDQPKATWPLGYAVQGLEKTAGIFYLILKPLKASVF